MEKFKKILIIFLVIEFFIIFINGSSSICIYQNNCEKCLAADYNCAWCADKNYVITKPRCMTKYELLQGNCTKYDIVENLADIKIIENKDTEDYTTNGIQIIQIQPQKIKLKLVKSRTETIKMTYRPAKNSPLDLYYLMDLTWSMRDDKQTLVNIGEKLANALRNLTKYYRLGYGSFADKPIMPMIMPGSEMNPCSVEHEICEPTYGFRHHLPLTINVNEFIEKVNHSQITGNLDNLEGGLDALMQVIVCSNEIGWSDLARKIVILATDGLMHFAGDGLLAGILKRNDKKCHLENTGEYIGTLDYDYPSLEEIYHELKRRKISVIFAVTQNVANSYYQMRDLMKEISNVEILSLDSSNILQLVEKGYQQFIRKAQFLDDSPPYIKVTYETDCAGTYSTRRLTNSCDQVEIGKMIDFYINITLNEFPNDGNYNHIIHIEEPGISESLEIEIEIQKPCPCLDESNKLGIQADNQKFCNNHGQFKCGMCFCEDGWIGNSCSCDSQNYTSIRALENQCRQLQNNNSFGQICTNHGECECGQCFCNRGYTGSYCECPECENCNIEHAKCQCGKCICNSEWTGKDCNCPVSKDTCISPKGEICSSRGQCNCGLCDCNGSYFGKYCEISSTAGNKLCAYYEPCVICLIEERLMDKSCENISKICSNQDGKRFNHEFVEKISDNYSKCLIRLTTKENIKCDHIFIYENDIFTQNELKIKINSCIPVDFAMIGIGFFIITLLLGLIVLIIIKTIFYLKDKKEFAKFEYERSKTQFEMLSPIYKSPVTRYEVPQLSQDQLNK